MSMDWQDKDGSPHSEDEMVFVISTDEVDRHGDIVSAGGWRLDAFRRNPVVLWAHDYRFPVVGRVVELWSDTQAVPAGPAERVGRLLARVRFAATPFAQQVAGLYRGGYQRGVSVGFRPLRYEERRDSRTGAFLGVRYLEQELLEVSLVPVPSNREALSRSEGAAEVLPAETGGGAGLGGELAGLLREALPERAPGAVSALRWRRWCPSCAGCGCWTRPIRQDAGSTPISEPIQVKGKGS